MALTGDGARDGAELLTCSGLDALQVMEADVKGSRAEKGCQRFDLLDLGDNKFSFYEVYENADAMAHHKTLPHYKGCAQLIAQLGSGVAGPVSPHLLHAPARGGLQGCQHGHRGCLTDCGQVCDCWALPVIKKVGEQRAADRGRTGTVWSAAKAHKMRSARVGLALSAHGGARPLPGVVVCVPRSCISTRGRAVNAARVGRRVQRLSSPHTVSFTFVLDSHTSAHDILDTDYTVIGVRAITTPRSRGARTPRLSAPVPLHGACTEQRESGEPLGRARSSCSRPARW